MKYKIGDKLRIIKRLPDNTTGSEDYGKPNGDVGKIGIVKVLENNHYELHSTNNSYLGFFKEEEVELVIKPESKSLVGRYLKALVNNPQAVKMEAGEYCKITSDKYDITRVKDNQGGFGYTSDLIGTVWELMPERFNPENKPEFIIGKWYKNLSCGYIAKAIEDSRLDGNSFYHGDYITDEKKFVSMPNITTTLEWLPTTCEIDISQIQQYLPSDHPDKIQDKWIPKVDDWVVVEKPCKSSMNKKGLISTITEIKNGKLEEFGSYTVYCINDWYEHISSIRKAEPYEIPVENTELSKEDLLEQAKLKYPIGTTIYCLHMECNYTIKSLGEFSIENNNSCIRVSNGCRCIYDSNIGWAEIISTPETVDKPVEYKVGDYVITKDWSDRYDGRILQITKIKDGKYHYFKVFDGGHYSQSNNFTLKRIQRKATNEEIHSLPMEEVIEDNTPFEWHEYPKRPEKAYQKEQSFDKPVLLKQFRSKRKLKVV